MSGDPGPAAPPWDVNVAVGKDAKTSACVYPSPAVLPGVSLPKLLVLEGPDGARRLVGAARVGGADDRTAVWVTAALLEKIAPGRSASEIVEATIKPASWGNIVVLMGREADRAVISATLTFLAAAAAAGVAFATSKVSIGVALLVLVLASLAALYKALDSIRDALTPRC